MSMRLVSLVVVLALAGCNDTDRGLGVLSVPAAGDTEAAELDDGHPVFVVHDPDSGVHVLEAVSTHLVDQHMAWCPTSRTIDDLFHGSRWDTQGRYVAGPAPKDLGRYEFDIQPDGERLVVLSYVEPAPRSESSSGMAGPTCFETENYEKHPFYDD